MNLPPIVEVRNLSKSLNGKSIIKSVTFSIHQGRTVALLGPNGAGKTTLLYLLLGLITPDSGVINIFGLPLKQNHRQIVSRMNFASPFVRLNGYATVYDNLLTIARLYQVENASMKILNLLTRFDILSLKNTRVFRLSAGENTRVNLCKALLNDPALLLLDEIGASLSAEVKKIVTEILSERKKRKLSCIYVSHDIQDVKRVCDFFLFMRNGECIFSGSKMPAKHIYSKHE